MMRAGDAKPSAANVKERFQILDTPRASNNGSAPPHSIDAELGLLCSTLISPDTAIPKCLEKDIDEQSFHVPAHRTIFAVAVDIYDAGKPIDLITFTQELRDRGLLESVGGHAFLTKLFLFVPSAANVDYYIDIVREKHGLRQIICACTESLRRAQEPQVESAELLDQIESAATSIRLQRGRSGSAGSLSIRSPDEVLAQPRDAHAILLGDWLLAIGQILVIAGVAGVGKSRLLLQLLVALILGRPWCGIETHANAPTCLMLQTENGIPRLQRDLEAQKKSAGRQWRLVEEKLRIHTLETDSDLLLHLSEPQNVRRIGATIRKENPDIVSFDPLRDFAIGDLNSDADMSATVREIGRVARVGNPGRALIILHHALTGRAGVAKAFGLERTGFARNSKVLHTAARGVINVAPANEDNNDTLVLTCGKNSNGREFPHRAVRLTDDLIYEVDDDFDVERWRERVTSEKTARKFTVECVRDLKFQEELEIKPLAKLICDKIGCGRSRAYELVHEGCKTKIFRHNKLTDTYAKV